MLDLFHKIHHYLKNPNNKKSEFRDELENVKDPAKGKLGLQLVSAIKKSAIGGFITIIEDAT